MDYNFHTHTSRCGHATGTEREYIKRALSCGIRHMGFSDHIPFRFPDGYESYYRIPTDLGNDYITTIRALRAEYQGEIDLHIGFEMECYPLYFNEMLQSARNYGAEYLILGHHFLGSEHPNGHYVGSGTDDPKLLHEYVQSILTGIQSGVFTYVAHPDIFHFKGDKALYNEEMKRICLAAKEHDVPLEINFLGIRSGRHYPTEKFWKLVGETGAPVTFGFDAHDAAAAYDGESLTVAKAWVQKFNLNDIGMPKLKPIK